MINEIFTAARTGDANHVKDLLDMDLSLANAENSDGLTLLGFAAHFGQEEVVKLLLENGAEVNAVSHSRVSYIPSNTALHAAIAGERSLPVIGLLLKHHAKPTIVDSNGHTALHVAAFHKDTAGLIRLLIEYGADVNAKSDGGVYPIDLAKQQDNTAVIDVLRQLGAVG
ncbi:ankyrin repeat domain-containing protein [Paenibacillus roseipurpureus]|uniref:Ankyrin repeat domain-containing protein n=1 Tax=Paenibacillus roseopurpureus TaxID=2918901 RepID=A0AA96LS53_9BACL|nr:ankyrin repeat domain-containing protein [Paenibacillus sp. MBLB1832]WNR44923.1 ankyrin repeat domain-containing protein [Paenibacillus sp. MBLB1832]